MGLVTSPCVSPRKPGPRLTIAHTWACGPSKAVLIGVILLYLLGAMGHDLPACHIALHNH